MKKLQSQATGMGGTWKMHNHNSSRILKGKGLEPSIRARRGAEAAAWDPGPACQAVLLEEVWGQEAVLPCLEEVANKLRASFNLCSL